MYAATQAGTTPSTALMNRVLAVILAIHILSVFYGVLVTIRHYVWSLRLKHCIISVVVGGQL